MPTRGYGNPPSFPVVNQAILTKDGSHLKHMNFPSLIRSISLAALICGVTSGMPARDHCLSVTGAGTRDGTSWENASEAAQLQEIIDQRLNPGDRLLIDGGVYSKVALIIRNGGKLKQPITLMGVDRGHGLPVFTGNWNIGNPDKGPTIIRLEEGASNLVIENLRMERCLVGIAAPSSNTKALANLVFNNVAMSEFRYGFYLSHVENLKLLNCKLEKYSKHAFRLDQGCKNVLFRNCTADCSKGDAAWEQQTEQFPFGYIVNNAGKPHQSIRFENCLAANHLMPAQTNSYKNGDGFVVEEAASDVSFVGCRAIRNQDGGFDLKAPDVRLEGCLALNNYRGFRIWQTGTLVNCLAGWGTSGLWCNVGPVQATRCTFHGFKDSAVMTDDRACFPITLKDCLLSESTRNFQNTSKGEVVLQDTLVFEIGSTPKEMGYEKPPHADWNGLGDDMNHTLHKDKGYRNPSNPMTTP